MHQNQTIDAIIAIFMLIGVLGNVNVILAIARKKILRTKRVLLILFLSIAHLVCNISELNVLSQYNENIPFWSYPRCFKFDNFYIFFTNFQSFLYLPIALDLFFSIVVPVKYKGWNTTRYVLAMLTFPIGLLILYKIFSVYYPPDMKTVCLFGSGEWRELDDEVPILQTYKVLKDLTVFCNMSTTLITIVSVVSAMIKSKCMHQSLSRTGRSEEEKVKVFRSTFFMVVIHVGSWLLINYADLFYNHFMNYWSIFDYIRLFVIPNVCQIYFVSYFGSPKLRKAYQEQLHCMTCGKLFPNIFKTEESRFTSTPNFENNDEDCDDTLIRSQV